jgi:ABC-type multidrug transport system ATPase subunit
MFLDEPTSGLDSFAAWNVMRTLHQLAHAGGHTVVASLHQPRAAIWAMCDQVGELVCVRARRRGCCECWLWGWGAV